MIQVLYKAKFIVLSSKEHYKKGRWKDESAGDNGSNSGRRSFMVVVVVVGCVNDASLQV